MSFPKIIVPCFFTFLCFGVWRIISLHLQSLKRAGVCILQERDGFGCRFASAVTETIWWHSGGHLAMCENWGFEAWAVVCNARQYKEFCCEIIWMIKGGASFLKAWDLTVSLVWKHTRAPCFWQSSLKHHDQLLWWWGRWTCKAKKVGTRDGLLNVFKCFLYAWLWHHPCVEKHFDSVWTLMWQDVKVEKRWRKKVSTLAKTLAVFSLLQTRCVDEFSCYCTGLMVYGLVASYGDLFCSSHATIGQVPAESLL